MPIEERRERHQALDAQSRRYDVHHWARDFLRALREPEANGGREGEHDESTRSAA